MRALREPVDIGDDLPPLAPVRLDVAARIAFPDGSMGPKGLRKERDAGRLVTEMIAGKEYTTLAAIEKMRELCRVPAKESVSSGGKKAGKQTGHYGTKPGGSSKMPDAEQQLAAARATLRKLRDNSQPTPPTSTSRHGTATVIPIK